MFLPYHCCAHDPRRVGVDGDVLFGQFHGVGGREAAHGVFGCRVVGEEREGFEGYDGSGGEEFACSKKRKGFM